MPPRKFHSLFAVVALMVMILVLFSPALFQGQIIAPLDITKTMLPPWGHPTGAAKPHNHFPSDAVTQYLPYRMFAEESLQKDGYIGWNPYEMGGYSLAANTMALPGSWPMQLHRWLPFTDAWNLGIVGEFLIAGMGMLVFLRSRKLGWIACLIGSVAFMLNAQFVIWIYHRWALGSFCWMPWLLWSSVGWKGVSDVTGRRCLLPFWIALALMGASLQHMVFVLLGCACVALGSLRMSDGFVAVRKSLLGWIFAGGMAVGMAAFTLVPQVQGYLANITTGHVRGGIGYEGGLVQPLLHILLIPARIWPWLAGDTQSMDAWKLLKSDIMSLNYLGTIPMLLGFAGLFVRSMPRIAKWLIVVGLVIPLTPLVGPLYHRVELLFILGGAWMTAEMLHHLAHGSVNKSAPSASNKGRYPAIRGMSRILLSQIFAHWQRFLIGAVATFGFGMVVATLIPSGIRGKIEQTVVSQALSKSADSQFGSDQAWIGSRAIEWTRRFSLTHPRTAWIYGLLIMGSTGLVLTANSKSSSNTHSEIQNPKFKIQNLTSHPSLGPLLILTATTLELGTFFHTWTTFSDPSDLRPSHPSIDTVRAAAAGQRVLQRSPSSGFVDVLATPNLLASYGIPSIDAYESIQYRNSLTALREQSASLQLALAGVGISVHPVDQPIPAGTENWTARLLQDDYSLRQNPTPIPLYAIGTGSLPKSPEGILYALHRAQELQPSFQSPSRLTLPLPLDTTNEVASNANTGTWIRIANNWHPGWKWKTGKGEWQDFHSGLDAACWIKHLPVGSREVQVQFFPRSPWLQSFSIAVILIWLSIIAASSKIRASATNNTTRP